MNASEDGDCFENDLSESSRTSIPTTPFENNLTLGRSLCDYLVTDTGPTTASLGPYHYPLDREIPSRPDLVQSATSYYPPFDHFLGSTFNHATVVESALRRDVNGCKPYIPVFPTHTMSPAPSQRADLNNSHTFDGMRSGEASLQGSHQQPRDVARNVSSSLPQMTLTIDNLDPRTMTSILEVLTKAKSKVTMSMNS